MRCGSFVRDVIDLALVASEDFRVVGVTSATLRTMLAMIIALAFGGRVSPSGFLVLLAVMAGVYVLAKLWPVKPPDDTP
jgi:hypothetical protein